MNELTDSNNRFPIEERLPLIFIFITFVFLFRLFGIIPDYLGAPFDLTYETPNLSTIKLIQAGENPYDPSTYSKAPFIITIYTPLYHYIVASLPIFDSNPFFFGRVVSMIAMFLAAFALFYVNKKNESQYLPIIAFGIFFSMWSITKNTAILKNDPLALLFSVYAIIITYKSQSPKAIIVAAVLSIFAILSKQSYVSASATCFLYLFISHRKSFFIYFLSMFILSLSFILVASTIWGEGFWFSTIDALRQNLSFQQGVFIWKKVLRQPAFCFIFSVSSLTAYLYLKKDTSKAFQESPYLIYMIISFTVLLLTIWKPGSADNYFHEFILSQFIWIVFAFRNKLSAYFIEPIPFIIVAILIICCIYEFSFSQRSDYSSVDKKLITLKTYKYQRMKKDVDSLNIKDPLILDLESPVHMYNLTKNITLNDPYHYKMLWHDGILSYYPLVESIEKQYFDIIMLHRNVTVNTILERPYSVIVKAIFKHYRIGHSGYYFNYYIREMNSLLQL